MDFVPTAIPDVIEILPKRHGDERGFFMETYREAAFADEGISARFVQDNFSRSAQHTLRGLHYQLKHPQGKLVRVDRGEVFDVVVDLRSQSPTFGQSVAVLLSAKKHNMLWVPAGFAHGFLVVSEEADFFYKCTDYYAPEYERSLLWSDPVLNIEWPLPKGVVPKLAAKDQSGALLVDADVYESEVMLV